MGTGRILIGILTLQSFLLSSGTAYAEKGVVFNIEPSRNQILKFTDQGVTPKVLTMAASDKILFFLNDTSESLTTLRIDFGKNMIHCHSTNLSDTPEGIVKSNRPFGPKDFATVCFHEPGKYPVTVYGLPKSPDGVSVNVTVE